MVKINRDNKKFKQKDKPKDSKENKKLLKKANVVKKIKTKIPIAKYNKECVHVKNKNLTNKIKTHREKINLNQKLDIKHFDSYKKENIFTGNSFESQTINEVSNSNHMKSERVSNIKHKLIPSKKPESIKPKMDTIFENTPIKDEYKDFSKENIKLTIINNKNECTNKVSIKKKIKGIGSKQNNDSVSKETNKNIDKLNENDVQSSSENNSIEKEFEESSEPSKETKSELEKINSIQFLKKEIKTPIIIKHINDSDDKIISIDKIKILFNAKKYDLMVKYKFPYMSMSKLSENIFPIDLKQIRILFFYCPECGKSFRHFSIPFHIFQSHFSSIRQYLTEKQIANACALILQKEYKKIDKSLKLFSEVATLFNSCNFRGDSEWRHNASKSIKAIKFLNIKQTYFSISLEQAKGELNSKKPLNKNKIIKRKYKNLENLLFLKKK